MPFITDTLTESSDVDLASHTGELGATWTDHTHANYTATFSVDAATDRIWSNGTAAYFASGVPPSADYSFEADFHLHSAISQNVAVCVRMDTTDDTMIIARLNNATIWEIRELVNGTPTTLGSSTNQLPSVGNSKRGRLEVRGTQAYLYVDNVLEIGPVTVTVTSAGRVGVRNAGTATASTGIHLDNLSANSLYLGVSLFRGRNFPFFDDEEVNRFEFWPAVAGGTDLVIQSASHSHTAENLTLTQDHILAIQNANHAHTSDNLALTQVHQLVTQNAAHDHSANNLTLTQTHVLIVNGASHSHTAENVVLVSAGDLVIQNAAQGHTAQNVVLTQVHELFIANSSHAHSAQNLLLTQAHELVTANAIHGHSAENLVLTQVHVLTVQSGTHNHSAENITLESEGTLGIQNAAHAHTATSLTLVQAHSLTVADATHGHTAESPSLSLNLSIQSAVHSHSAENLALTQAHSLTVASAVHGHTGENLALGTENDLLISSSVHAHTTSGVSFDWVIPGDAIFTVVDSQIFTIPTEDNIFEI